MMEIKGGAQALGIPTGILAIINLGYEISDACTSIVAETNKGEILHARNLDFGAGMGFTDDLRNLTINLDFQRNGKTVYHGVTYVGYVGLLTGMKPGGFSVTVNTRFLPNGILDMLQTIIQAVLVQDSSVVSLLVRETLEKKATWNEAMYELSTRPLITDVYLTVAGIASGEGAVITRNRTGADDIWKVNSSDDTWYVIETNFDRWEEPPWYDNRRYYANNAMHEMGRNGISFPHLQDVLSVKPVLNRLTTYSSLISPKDNYFEIKGRFCNAPCPD
eukprot:TRINITY_DN4550_c0_g1_i2.p1 TRINITY_DN4550_c0_g1~~TRINITY_DN4550_c0_g1_i2.p1  ORF type:complete len:276 (+),score=44.97 TRINITY_DN4550_c0_g1_i2:764-1591(+)